MSGNTCQCGKPGTEEINGQWFCDTCARFINNGRKYDTRINMCVFSSLVLAFGFYLVSVIDATTGAL